MHPLVSASLRAALFAAGLAVACLPRCLELRLGGLLGSVFLAADRKRKAIARENMARCLPELAPERREDLLADNYRHYGILALELLHYFSPIPGHWRAYARRVGALEGYEHWDRANRRGKGVIFISAHMANWEMMAAVGSLHGIPLILVTRHLKPEWLHKRIEAQRLSVGTRGVYQPRTLPTVLKALRRGESVGFVMDQYMHPPMGSPVPFFGVEVDTLAAVPAVINRTGAAVVPVTQRREPDGRLRIVISPEIEPGPASADPKAATARLVAEVERMIRDNPGQWLWVHRRFKNVKG
ncbi:MAG: lysophospholipid acyltransferase family protein [Elusimicrobia bacterium]|nr:lysophospholipid acyltransferase family protein [Elusimicrobiota bacterium]